MDGGVVVVLDQLLGDQDGVLEVVSAPRHEGHQDVASQRQLTGIGAGPVGEHLALADPLPFSNHRLLRNAGVLVAALELDQLIDVGAELFGLAGLDVFRLDSDDDAVGVDQVDDAGALAEHHGAGVARHDVLHPGAHQRGIGAEQRHGLPLHVGAHQCAVRVVVLQEGNERSSHRDELFRRDVDEVDLLLLDGNEVAGLPGDDAIVNEIAFLVHHHVGLRDRVALFIPRREVEGVRLCFAELELRLLLRRGRRVFLGNAVVVFLQVLLLDDLAEGEGGVADLDHSVVIEHPAVIDLLVRRLDEAVLVDAGVAGQRRDQTDVRTFGGLDRTDAAVVSRVNVAHFESCALAGETTRSQG